MSRPTPALPITSSQTIGPFPHEGWRFGPDWFAIHADIRDHVFDIDLLGQEKTSHNLEAHVGVTFFF